MKSEETRSFDCIQYGDCLTSAALSDSTLDCSTCEMRHNSEGALHTDDVAFDWELNATLRLIVEIFKKREGGVCK